MTPEQWQQVREIYEAVVEREPFEREAALAEACAGDEQVRAQVEQLLSLRGQAASFFETPPLVDPAWLQAATSADAAAGRRVGPYQLVREIGHGGMSTVYLAVRADDEYKKEVAIKLVWPGLRQDEVVRRFRQERQILAQLDHPNIARLLDGGTADNGWPYLVMEYVEGVPITEYCRRRQLSVTERLQLFRTICDAVQYAHRNLIIHRDLKPSNILVTEDGTVKLLDFGIAKILNPSERGEQVSLTQSQLHWMTPEYASPEQLRGEKVTTASDVYSLGVVLYELLTGERPHRVQNLPPHEVVPVLCEREPEKPSTRAAQFTEPPPGLAEGSAEKLRRRLRGDLDNIVLMALAKEPARRYPSVEQLSADVTRHLEGKPVLARSPTLGYRAGRYVRRHKFGVTLSALFVLALVAGTIAATQRARQAEAQARYDRRLLYAAQMRQAGYDLGEENNFTRLRATLESFIPKPGAPREDDLRGFEWYYLQRQAHREKLVLPLGGWGYAVAYSPDGTKIAAACEDGTAKVWDAVTGSELFTLRGHKLEVFSVAFSPDGRLIVTGGHDGTIQFWNVATGIESASWPGNGTTGCSFSLDGKRLLIGSGRYITLNDTITGKSLLSRVHADDELLATTFLPDGRRFVSAGQSGLVKVWDATTGRLLNKWNAHSGKWVFALAVSSDGRRLLTGGGDWKAKLWDMKTGKLLTTFAGHTNAVRGVAFSPDGRRVVTASADRLVKLWDAATGMEVKIFKGHTDRIRAVAFSPDGRSIASCGDDRAVRVWRVTDEGEPPELLTGHTERIFSVAFSPNGQLATASSDNTAKLWDGTTGREITTLTGHSKELYSVAFALDGQRLATASADATVKFWQATTGQKLNIQGFTSDASEPPPTAFTPEGQALVGTYQDGTIRLLNLETGQPVVTLKGHAAYINSLTISADGKRFATGSADHTAKLWDAATGRELRTFSGHTGRVHTLELSADGKQLFTSATDDKAKIWDTDTGRELFNFGEKAERPFPKGFSPNGKLLVVENKDYALEVWNSQHGQKLATLTGHTSQVGAVAFSPDGRWLASGSDDQTAKLWELNTGRDLATLHGHKERIYSVALSPDGRVVASASVDRTIKLWDVQTQSEIRTLNGHAGAVGKVSFSPDGNRLLSNGYDGATILWDVATGQQLAAHRQMPTAGTALSVAFSPNGRSLATSFSLGVISLYDTAAERFVAVLSSHTAEVWTVRFSPDSRFLASASWDRTVKLWDVGSGRELHTFPHAAPVTTLAFSPDGKLLATGSDDHTVKLWDLATKRELRTLAGHADQVLTVTLSPDGHRLVSGGTDKSIRIWDVETGQELLALRGHTDEVWSVAFSPDGQTLASGSWDKSVRLWRMATAEEIKSGSTSGQR